MPNHSVVRQSVFEDDSVNLLCERDRRRGRPRNTWGSEVHKVACVVAADQDLESLLADKMQWELAVKRFCFQRP